MLGTPSSCCYLSTPSHENIGHVESALLILHHHLHPAARGRYDSSGQAKPKVIEARWNSGGSVATLRTVPTRYYSRQGPAVHFTTYWSKPMLLESSLPQWSFQTRPPAQGCSLDSFRVRMSSLDITSSCASSDTSAVPAAIMADTATVTALAVTLTRYLSFLLLLLRNEDGNSVSCYCCYCCYCCC